MLLSLRLRKWHDTLFLDSLIQNTLTIQQYFEQLQNKKTQFRSIG
ncbi:MAG: hypothetical protein JETT_3951 [Candidatus Jettenia ecosi]|uniref:Uncharacterized protein n=1 Tax=Candidatus Jettenia ecosi TaxID=2494326 RepID=A0A533Q6P9_9BACT|nr:MAG: hypothetical protein JETT_3951 [Candidatus Jettenia ecosi]